jgi:soluble lytic murein transglycosylase-like protein
LVCLDKPASRIFKFSLGSITFILACVTSFFVLREHYFPERYRKYIYNEATKQKLDPFLVAAVIYRESGFKEKVVSKHGDIGLMQILPITLKELKRLKLITQDEINEQDLLEYKANIRVGTLYLSYLVNRIINSESRKEKVDNWYKGNPIIPMLISYNAGPTISLQGYLDHSKSLEDYINTVRKNRPTTWRYSNDIIKIKKRIEWFDKFLNYF